MKAALEENSRRRNETPKYVPRVFGEAIRKFTAQTAWSLRQKYKRKNKRQQSDQLNLSWVKNNKFLCDTYDKENDKTMVHEISNQKINGRENGKHKRYLEGKVNEKEKLHQQQYQELAQHQTNQQQQYEQLYNQFEQLQYHFIQHIQQQTINQFNQCQQQQLQQQWIIELQQQQNQLQQQLRQFMFPPTTIPTKDTTTPSTTEPIPTIQTISELSPELTPTPIIEPMKLIEPSLTLKLTIPKPSPELSPESIPTPTILKPTIPFDSISTIQIIPEPLPESITIISEPSPVSIPKPAIQIILEETIPILATTKLTRTAIQIISEPSLESLELFPEPTPKPALKPKPIRPNESDSDIEDEFTYDDYINFAQQNEFFRNVLINPLIPIPIEETQKPVSKQTKQPNSDDDSKSITIPTIPLPTPKSTIPSPEPTSTIQTISPESIPTLTQTIRIIKKVISPVAIKTIEIGKSLLDIEETQKLICKWTKQLDSDDDSISIDEDFGNEFSDNDDFGNDLSDNEYFENNFSEDKNSKYKYFSPEELEIINLLNYQGKSKLSKSERKQMKRKKDEQKIRKIKNILK